MSLSALAATDLWRTLRGQVSEPVSVVSGWFREEDERGIERKTSETAEMTLAVEAYLRTCRSD